MEGEGITTGVTGGITTTVEMDVAADAVMVRNMVMDEATAEAMKMTMGVEMIVAADVDGAEEGMVAVDSWLPCVAPSVLVQLCLVDILQDVRPGLTVATVENVKRKVI